MAYRGQLEAWRASYGKSNIRALKRKQIERMLGEKVGQPSGANNWLSAVRVLLGFAVKIGMIDSNPALAVSKVSTKGEYHCWTEGEIEQFEHRWPIGTSERLAFALTLYTGQRRSDVTTIRWADIRDCMIALRQKKTGAALVLPIHPRLAEALDAAPRRGATILVNRDGAIWSQPGFGCFFRRAVKAAELPGQCTPHGLRKAIARRLAEGGASTHQIAAITGHRSLKEIEHYSRAAEQARLARSAIARLDNSK
jgi:integrase